MSTVEDKSLRPLQMGYTNKDSLWAWLFLAIELLRISRYRKPFLWASPDLPRE